MEKNKKEQNDEYKQKEKLLEEIIKRENAWDEMSVQEREEAYQSYVKKVTPSYSLAGNMAKAFLVGGLICCLGQAIMNFCTSRGLDHLTAGKWTSLLLVLASAVLTGLNIYPSLAQFAGAGVLVPITGFANGIAASALEFKKEGQVFGIGAQIFGIGGPVILYGILTSWVLGLIYWFLKIGGVV